MKTRGTSGACGDAAGGSAGRPTRRGGARGGRARRVRRIATLALVTSALALGATGCSLLGGQGSPGDPYARSQTGRKVLEVVVINLNFNDATLWVVSRAGKRVRLGMVTGKDEGHFSIPWEFSEPMAIEIDMVAGPRCTSDTLTADPGDIIELRIDVAFSESSTCRPLGR